MFSLINNINNLGVRRENVATTIIYKCQLFDHFLAYYKSIKALKVPDIKPV